MWHWITRLFFPPKCVLCQALLREEETDLCRSCREKAPEYPRAKLKISFIADWSAVWYYKDDVRSSILRFKFGRRRFYADTYGRLLAMKLMTTRKDDFDVLTWVSTSSRRKRKRGYDQAQLIAQAVARELGVPLTRTLKKIRHTPPQSTLQNAAQRRANVLGAYRVVDPEAIAGKRVLLLDDILTTGATASECARVLITAGAKEVTFAAVAAACDHTKK
jgi:ComF family protein